MWKWKWSRSVVSNPQRPHGLQPSRLLHPWDFPGKSTGVGCQDSKAQFAYWEPTLDLMWNTEQGVGHNGWGDTSWKLGQMCTWGWQGQWGLDSEHGGNGESELKVAQSCLTLCDPMDYTVHGILQARILEWVAFPFSKGSSQPRDQTQVSCIAGGFFTRWATREAQGKNVKKGHDGEKWPLALFRRLTN